VHAALLATILTILSTVELAEWLTEPACVACATPAADDVPGLPRLRAGETLLTEENGSDAAGIPRHVVEVAVVLPYRPTQIWSVLVDFAGRPAWQPGTEDVTVVRTDGNRVWVDESVRFFFVDVRYRLELTLDTEAGTIRFAMDEESPHDIGGASGHWQLRQLDDGRATLVAYRAWIDFGHGLPRFLQTWLVRHSLPRLLDNLREEGDRRFGVKR
jgi:ribosome-associated toxin RatA of RatAB toxin-antitoxin module